MHQRLIALAIAICVILTIAFIGSESWSSPGLGVGPDDSREGSSGVVHSVENADAVSEDDASLARSLVHGTADADASNALRVMSQAEFYAR
ncbi:MAG: hypothetical protein V3V08_20185, partial [Nannocystaceae bacterium]